MSASNRASGPIRANREPALTHAAIAAARRDQARAESRAYDVAARSPARRLLMSSRMFVAISVVLCSLAPSMGAHADSAFALRSGGTRLLGFSTNAPQTVTLDLTITGIVAGETLVGIDVRPQNGQLYGLGVNATANTATLYAISARTGVAGTVGTPGSIAFVTGSAVPIDLPDPASTGYGFDFNPAADRVRVVAGALNFRVNPNTGAPIDGDQGGAAGSVVGVNVDGLITGGTNTVSATAYSNDRPNLGVTTQYTLDDSSNRLFIQNPPNSGTQTLGTLLVNGVTPVDFTAINGFEIPAYVDAPSNNLPATGTGFAALSVAGVHRLHLVDLVNGQTTPLGNIGDGSTPTQGLSLRQGLPGVPMIGLSQNGLNLVRFSSNNPAFTTTAGIQNIQAGEALVGIDFRPQTGQLFALGVNATIDNATLYLIDPQASSSNATAFVVGSAGMIQFVDASGVATVDLPDPATAGYGIDFNPTIDRVRITTSTGLNFRVNPNTGAAIDGNLNQTPAPSGTNPDAPITGLPGGSTGVSGAAHTNNFGQSLTGGVTTLYTLDAAANALFLQNPPNAGSQTARRDILLNGNPLDFSDSGGFDIAPDVSVSASGTPAVGIGYAALIVGGSTQLYSIDLASGDARQLGTVPLTLRGLTVGEVQATDMFRNGFE
jgi:hypothetical protein